MAVMSILPAVTLMDHILVHVKLGILEMAELVVVCLFRVLFIYLFIVFVCFRYDSRILPNIKYRELPPACFH